MTGVMIPVVGPSGAGKDTLIDAARAARPDIYFPTRVITRPFDAGGEVFRGVDPSVFATMADSGHFAFHWQAHGLHYGIPAEIIRVLEAGRSVMFNGSRGIIDLARQRFEKVHVMVVTAPEDILAKRLAARNREQAGEIRKRLKRAAYSIPSGDDVRIIQNDGPLEKSRSAFLAALPVNYDV